MGKIGAIWYMHLKIENCCLKKCVKIWVKKYVEKRVMLFRARLVHVFKNWKLLFENIYGNTCRWKSVLKCMKCLKTENSCLKT